jgi:beta-N-acetylhexosaminidase
VAVALAALTPAQKAGQLVMSGVPVASADDGRSQVKSLRLGGVFLHGRTSTKASSIRADVRRLPGQKAGAARIGLLVSVDQEGGKVQTLRHGSWPRIPAATSQGKLRAATLTARWRTWAGDLHDAGLTMNLAPVADVVPAGTEASNPPIGALDRQFGSTPAAVSRSVRAAASGMADARIIPTVKHFPGLGRVHANTDTSTKAVDRVTTVNSPSLRAFTAGIDAGAVVMVSSASYPRIDADHLGVFSSKVITALLRQKLGYDGVVMTDDVGQAVAVRSTPTGHRATKFIAAGGDLVLTVVPARAPALVKAIRDKAAASATFRARVDASVTRVLTLKEQHGLLTC